MDFVKDFYENYYSKVFSSDGISSRFNSLTHKALEFRVSNQGNKPTDDSGYSILEIGAGKGEHFGFVKKDFDSYCMLDIITQPIEISQIEGATWIQEDICSPNLRLDKYDRIISMCVFHHLHDPVIAMENIKKSLKNDGVFSLFLPSDPGILNRMVRKFFVTPNAKKQGFDYYELVNAREHKNHYWGLKKELEYQFKEFEITKRYYPFGIPAGNLSLFSIWHMRKK